MRPGPPRGESVTAEVTVSTDLLPADAPAAYPSAALARDVDQLCRELIRPHLEAGEVSLGVRLELLQRVPVPLGATVELTVSVASVQPKGVVYEVLARQAGRIVARGSCEFSVTDEATLNQTLAGEAAS